MFRLNHRIDFEWFFFSSTSKTINEWTFDVFSVNEFTNGQSLRYVGFELMQRYNLTNKLHVKSDHFFDF
jgi:calcium/calmodulin-dependent 3',5'-cyclic nucleotide phosphodiesterase